MRLLLFRIAAALCWMLVPSAARAGAELGLHLAPCVQGHSNVAAECGSFGVYEDRAAGFGRIVSLRLVVLKSKHHVHRAIALIAGGPGQSAVAAAPFIADGKFAKELSVLRDDYDLLFVDNRGMGGSNPFACDLAPRAHPGDYFRQLWPDALLSACRAKSTATSNPGLYNTINAVDDLDDVRAALGYPRLVLDGSSYGTFFSFVAMRRHPDRIESVILDAAYAPHFQPLPGAPAGAQIALDDLVVKCRRDAVCNSHFPAFAHHFDALVRRFDRGPIAVRVKNVGTQRVETVMLSKEVFVDRLRQVLYDPQNASSIPYVVERAYHADYSPLGRVVNVVSLGLAQGINWGAFLSYSCADEVPFISEAEVEAQAARSFARDLRVRAQQKACAIWHVPPAPPSLNDAVRSAAPVLIVSGSDDPATPPRYAAEASRFLPNAKQVVVRGAGHATETGCTQRLIVQFVRARSAKGLDVSRCTAAFKMPHFDTSLVGWPNP